MTSLDELKRIAGRERVGLGVIEKDHAITVILSVLSKTRLSETLVFKGGTAIKKMYYPEARFSLDLDFDCQHDLSRELEKSIKKPLIENREDVNFTGVRLEESRAELGRRLSIQYKDSNGYPNSIKLDLAFRQKPVMRTRTMAAKNPYGIENVTIATMDIKEIMAEKLRALIHVRKARHLYDIWFLLSKGVTTTKKLADRKLKMYGEKFEIDALMNSMKEVEGDWQTDLEALVSEVPKFSRVRSDVIGAFRELLHTSRARPNEP